jgi:hypothetical protein
VVAGCIGEFGAAALAERSFRQFLDNRCGPWAGPWLREAGSKLLTGSIKELSMVSPEPKFFHEQELIFQDLAPTALLLLFQPGEISGFPIVRVSA